MMGVARACWGDSGGGVALGVVKQLNVAVSDITRDVR